MENPAPPYPIQSVDYALQLLLILKRDGVLRVSEAAAELGVARSTAHRLISMLRFRGLVEQARDRTYRAGSAFADLGGGPSSATALLGIARPHLVRLIFENTCHASCQLGFRQVALIGRQPAQ